MFTPTYPLLPMVTLKANLNETVIAGTTCGSDSQHGRPGQRTASWSAGTPPA